MNDYISREAVLAVLDWDCASQDALNAIKAIPAADVVEVVRCRDCRNRDPEDKKCDSGALERAGCVFAVDDDYYCADGERKDGGQDDV